MSSSIGVILYAQKRNSNLNFSQQFSQSLRVHLIQRLRCLFDKRVLCRYLNLNWTVKITKKGDPNVNVILNSSSFFKVFNTYVKMFFSAQVVPQTEQAFTQSLDGMKTVP